MNDPISNSEDVIDSRDVMKRIEELESETDGAIAVPPHANDSTWRALLLTVMEWGWNSRRVAIELAEMSAWITRDSDAAEELAEKRAEYQELAGGSTHDDTERLNALEEEISDLDSDLTDSEVDVTEECEELRTLQAFAEDFDSNARHHGETLIREDYFEQYAEELAGDLHGREMEKASWPFDCIDWSKAADALRADYSNATFGGVDYLFRAS
jgi:hypothetical protein